MKRRCKHREGYYITVETHYGVYDAWACADCGLEVPLDK